MADEDAPALLPAPTLEEYLQAQIGAGATFATTPTGVMRAGDRRSLKKAIRQVNDLDRDDVVFYVPLELAWFTSANVKGLIGVLAACKHPVAIAIADSNGDPYTKVLPALRSVVASLSYGMIWRVRPRWPGPHGARSEGREHWRVAGQARREGARQLPQGLGQDRQAAAGTAA